jgi:putative DNA-invertase from lambdoid prophage Rac
VDQASPIVLLVIANVVQKTTAKTEEKPMKRFGWVRVSTSKQEVSQQIEALKSYDPAITIYKAVGVKGDEAFSHPKFQALLRAVKQEEEEVEVVVAYLDRWGRDPEEAITGVKLLTSMNASFTSLKEHVHCARSDNDTGMLTLRILAAVAGWEKARIQDRTRMALADLKRQNVPLGPSPKLTTADCDWIKQRHFQDGWGYQRIAKAMPEHRNKTVSKSTVMRVLGKGGKPYVPSDGKTYRKRAMRSVTNS